MAQISENIRYGGFDEDEMSQPTILNHAIALDDYIAIWIDAFLTDNAKNNEAQKLSASIQFTWQSFPVHSYLISSMPYNQILLELNKNRTWKPKPKSCG